jgi:hypothetical protein
LPEEIKQQILSFATVPGNFEQLARLLATTKETQRLVNDPIFLKDFAKRTFDTDAERAKKLLDEAAEAGNVTFTKAFIKADESLKKYANELLFKAASHDWLRSPGGVKKALSEYEQVEATALKKAKTLLEAGADPNIESTQITTPFTSGLPPEKRTPLIEAAERMNDKMVELLLNHKANPNAQDAEDLSALHGCRCCLAIS